MAKLSSSALPLHRKAGVKIDLMVRGICCLRPKIPGVSDNITVRSVVDRFLEHSRIFYFENAGRPEYWAGSADRMPRNFFRRIEAVFPIEDPKLRLRVKNELLGIRLRTMSQSDEDLYRPGKYYDEEEQQNIRHSDHGLLFTETASFEEHHFPAYNGRVFKLTEHIERLFYSAKAILLEIPMAPKDVAAAVVQCCRKNKIRDGYIRLVVTRGVGTLGLNPNKCKSPSIIIIAGAIQLYPAEMYKKGLEIITVATTRNLHSAFEPCAIKSLNYPLTTSLARDRSHQRRLRRKRSCSTPKDTLPNARATTSSSSKPANC